MFFLFLFFQIKLLFSKLLNGEVSLFAHIGNNCKTERKLFFRNFAKNRMRCGKWIFLIFKPKHLYFLKKIIFLSPITEKQIRINESNLFEIERYDESS